MDAVAKPGVRKPRVPRAPAKGTITTISADEDITRQQLNAMYDTKQSLATLEEEKDPSFSRITANPVPVQRQSIDTPGAPPKDDDIL